MLRVFQCRKVNEHVCIYYKSSLLITTIMILIFYHSNLNSEYLFLRRFKKFGNFIISLIFMYFANITFTVFVKNYCSQNLPYFIFDNFNIRWTI